MRSRGPEREREREGETDRQIQSRRRERDRDTNREGDRQIDSGREGQAKIETKTDRLRLNEQNKRKPFSGYACTFCTYISAPMISLKISIL